MEPELLQYVRQLRTVFDQDLYVLCFHRGWMCVSLTSCDSHDKLSCAEAVWPSNTGGAKGGRLPLLGALALATLPGVAIKQLINCVQLRMAAQALIARDRRAAPAGSGPGAGAGAGSGGSRRTRDKGMQS